jgi:hypothetical protein
MGPLEDGVNFTAFYRFVLIMVNYIKLKRALKWLFVLLRFSTEFFDFNVWHLRAKCRKNCQTINIKCVARIKFGTFGSDNKLKKNPN